MGTTAVRISKTAHEKLRRMAEENGVSLIQELDRIIETQRRQHFIEKANRAYAACRENEARWTAHLAERHALEHTLLDGLEAEPPYDEADHG